MIVVEVVYALPEQQWLLVLQVAPESTAQQVLQKARLSGEFPALSWDSLQIGVFSRPVSEDYVMQPGDRLEIYRPLLIDPKQKRLTRVKSKLTRRRSLPRHINRTA